MEEYIKTDLKRTVWEWWLHSFRSEYDSVAGSCEHSNELQVFIKGGEFLTNRVTISFARTPLNGVSQLVIESVCIILITPVCTEIFADKN
jgi:hypothetical protein